MHEEKIGKVRKVETEIEERDQKQKKTDKEWAEEGEKEEEEKEQREEKEGKDFKFQLIERDSHIFILMLNPCIAQAFHQKFLLGHSWDRAFETKPPFLMCQSVSTAVSFPAEAPWAGVGIFGGPWVSCQCVCTGSDSRWVGSESLHYQSALLKRN